MTPFSPRDRISPSAEALSGDHELDQPRARQQLGFTGAQFFRGVKCQERVGVAQRFRAGRLIQLSEIDDSACAGESVGHDRFSLSSKATTSDGRLSTMQHQG
jgi:hypothetical protein